MSLPSVTSSHYETLFSAAYSLCFFVFLRVGEVTVVDSKNSDRMFTSSHIRLKENKRQIELTIPFSKTDQLGKGETIIISETGSNICPLLHLKNYIKSRPSYKGPFFCHFGGKPLTLYQFTAVLSKVLASLGADTNLYKSHSFRIGAAASFIKTVIQKMK